MFVYINYHNDFQVIIENWKIAEWVFPRQAVGNGVYEEINLVEVTIARDVHPRKDLDSSQTDCLRTLG